MSNPNWPEVERALADALELPQEHRAAYLVRLLPLVRFEVESLLAAKDRASGFLGGSSSGPSAESVVTAMATSSQLGQYRIEALIGQGGMSQVYRAHDTKLNRTVAVKFLSEHLADPAARRRFQREAQMASSLNHPHIVHCHDVWMVQR